MKAKNLSFISLFMLTVALLGGCKGKDNNENVSQIIFKVGDKQLSAKQLYDELIAGGTGANEAFSYVARLVIESSISTKESKNLASAADLEIKKLEDTAKQTALSSGTKKEDELKKLIEEKGYSSKEEYRNQLIYERKNELLEERFWEENKGAELYYDKYIENRLPYLVRHVLVKLGNNSNQYAGNSMTITEAQAKDIYDIIHRIENSTDNYSDALINKFAYIANQEGASSGSENEGGLYYFDYSNGPSGLTDGFMYGTYLFDAYTTKKVENGKTYYEYGKVDEKYSKLVGMDQQGIGNYYDNGFNFISMDVVNALGEYYNKNTSFTISSYKENNGVYESASKLYNSTTQGIEANYVRNIIFNNAFNKPGFSVIGYNSEQEAIDSGARYYVELRNGSESKWILTDEKGNPVFTVGVNAGSGDYRLHFIVIEMSSLNDLNEAKRFFSIKEEKEEGDTKLNYVDVKNVTGTSDGARAVRLELEKYIKSYATSGLGNAEGETSLLRFDMIKHYMGENITYKNSDLEKVINAYIDNRKKLLNLNYVSDVSNHVETYSKKLSTYLSDEVQKGLRPYECAPIYMGDDSNNNPYSVSGNSITLCRYIYGQGYQVKFNYKYFVESDATPTYNDVSTSSSASVRFANPNQEFYYFTGSDKVNLAEIEYDKEIYELKGIYTDKKGTAANEVKKDANNKWYVDLSKVDLNNHTVFYVKLKAKAGITFKYTYKYEGTDITVSDGLGLNNTNTSAILYKASDSTTHTYTFDSNKFSSSSLEFVKTTIDGVDTNTLALSDSLNGTSKEIVVYVKPKATKFKYVYIDANNNNEVLANPDDVFETMPTGVNEQKYVPGASDVSVNKYSIEEPTQKSGQDKTVTYKYSLSANFESATSIEDSEKSIEITEDMAGKEVTVYVVVE